MFELAKQRSLGKELRAIVVEALAETMKENPQLVALDADLGAASKWSDLKKESAQRFINVGISEANMMGVAAGLSLTGFIPFVHTFAPFATRRALDQIFISGAYGQNTLNIWGSDPGFTAGHNGGTHTSWEDIALLRSIPDVVICDAADAVQLNWIIKEFIRLSGVHYVRSNRKAVHTIYKEGATFELGKANSLTKGTDYLVIVAGQLTYEALQLAEFYQTQNISLQVVDMFTIKPIDKQAILTNSVDKKGIITIENHSITGGLGSAVAEVISEAGLGIPLKRVGVTERFGQVGQPDYLQQEFGLSLDQLKLQLDKFFIEVG